MFSYVYPFIRLPFFDAWIGFKPVLLAILLYFAISSKYKNQHFKGRKETAVKLQKKTALMVWAGICAAALLLYWLSPAAGSADTIVVKVANTYLIYEPLLGIAVLVALLFTICRKQALPTWQHMRILDKIFSLTVLGTILSTLLARQVTTVRIAGLPWFAWLGWLVNFSYLAILVWICKQIWLWWENFQPDSGPDERSGGFQPIESFEQLFLQRQKLAEEIADIIIAHDVNEPLSICVAGPWGVGKTSVVNGAIHRLKQKSTACQYECLYVHAMELDTLVSLFSYVFSRIRAILKKHGAYVGIGSEYRKFLTAAVGKITDASIATLLESRLFPSSDDYRTQMKDLETCISAVMKGDKILVIVDDVERCEAKKAQQFIFFIKEIATMRNCIAIFLADYEYLKQTLSFNAEKDEDERRRKEYFFFEKFFNCRIDVPPVTFEDAIEKLEAEVAGPAQKLGMRTPAELFLRFEQKFKYQAERYREQANGKKDAKERDYMLSCAEELDQLSGLLRSNLSVPRMLVKYYHEMKRVYSRLIKQYAEHGMLKEKISRFFLRIRFDEIAFLLTYIEVCAPYEAFCLKEQGVTYLQFPEDPVSPTRKLIRKLGEDLLYSGIHIYIGENEAYRYSEAIQFTEAYIRRDIPKEVGKFSSRDELWINAIKNYDITLIEGNWAKMVQMVAKNYAWQESEKGKEYLEILFSFARERFLCTTDGIDRVFSIFNRSQRNDEVFSGYIAVMSIFETELGGALADCSQKNVKVLEQFSKVYLWKRTNPVCSAARFLAPAEHTGDQQFQLRMSNISESTLSEDDPVRALERLVKNICNIVPSIEPLPGDSIFQQLRFLADKEEKYMESNNLMQYEDIQDQLQLLRTAIDDMESFVALLRGVSSHTIPTGGFMPDINMQDLNTTIERFRNAINSPDANRDTSLRSNFLELFNQIRFGNVMLSRRQYEELQNLLTDGQKLCGYAPYNRKVLVEHLSEETREDNSCKEE